MIVSREKGYGSEDVVVPLGNKKILAYQVDLSEGHLSLLGLYS